MPQHPQHRPYASHSFDDRVQADHGSGTRLYEGKDYFTIYDFVEATTTSATRSGTGHHFHPRTRTCVRRAATTPASARNPLRNLAPYVARARVSVRGSLARICGEWPCTCERKPRAKVKLADGKARTIEHMMCTTFWHPDGTPVSAQQFMEMLFGKLPEFFGDEAELRALWSAPDTRKKLLDGLAEKGFGRDQLAEMQKIIDAERSDLFDVLAYVAYALPPLTRNERAAHAKVVISTTSTRSSRSSSTLCSLTM